MSEDARDGYLSDHLNGSFSSYDERLPFQSYAAHAWADIATEELERVAGETACLVGTTNDAVERIEPSSELEAQSSKANKRPVEACQ